MKKLIIVESPTKAKTIARFLGAKYQIESSFGHIRDLPKSTLGIDVDNRYEPKYLIPLKARKTVKNLKNSIKDVEEVILASDEDREGEAIAWHLQEALGLEKQAVKRIVFHEITEEALQEAIQHPRQINMNVVDAQQARRILDRIVGYKLSPFLWKKIGRGLSAGRVQSVALRLIVERENEIRHFKAEEYWIIVAILHNTKDTTISCEAFLSAIDGKIVGALEINNKKKADEIVSDLKKSSYHVVDVEEKEIKRNPSPPFTTSTLQQAASSRLHFGAKKTMLLAQKLYEHGHITYMRTDSVNLSHQSTIAAREWLTSKLGVEYALASHRFFTTKSKGAQEAHEAIRPTQAHNTPESIHLDDEGEKKLYKLIWQRFIASQMPQARLFQTTISIDATGNPYKKTYTLKVHGQRMIFDGYMRIWPHSFEDTEVPRYTKNDVLAYSDILPTQHFTEPPPRFNEASLVKILEEYGIGRPSTYAPIISVIQERNYVEKENRRFHPTNIGEKVNDMLVKHFPNIVDSTFTADMENSLDAVAEGKEKWQDLIDSFYLPFMKNLEEKEKEVKALPKPEPEKTDEKCEKCGEPMLIRVGRFGKFMACSGFPKCKNTKNLETEENKPESTGLKCPDCHEGDIVKKFTRKRGKKPFWGCSRYPECKHATWDNPLEPKNKKN